MLDGACDAEDNVVDVERFRDVVVRSEADGLAGRLDVRMGCDEYDGEIGVERAQGTRELETVHPRHPDVHDYGIEFLRTTQ